ncbi:MAG: SIMPL domain-containing protein [Novosphingobium sp.]
MDRRIVIVLTLAALAACHGKPDARGLTRDETLLSLSASGEAATVPDLAVMSIGVEAFGGDAKAASKAIASKSAAIVAALKDFGVSAGDVQTSNLALNRIDYGPHKGQFQARNTLTARLHDVPKAGEAVAAVTSAGANVLSGPSLQIDDPEKANRGAYIAAYKAARTRAEAYADAADMKVVRVLNIRDGGQDGGGSYAVAMQSVNEANEPAPPIVAPPPMIMPGTNRTRVSVQVDFALTPK